MSKIIIISDAVNINVDFGDYFLAGVVKFEKITIRRNEIRVVRKSEDRLTLQLVNDGKWIISNLDNLESQKVLKIDTINEIVPTDLDDLYNKISDLIL